MELALDKFHFSWPDYLVLGLVLLVSALVGVYYGCTGSKQTSTVEYLMAGRKMATFPVAMSLMASFVSATALLGLPSEIYFHGTQITLCIVAFIFVMPATAYLYMPVFYRLRVTSAYEYLELRFNRAIRCMCSAMYTIQLLMLMSVCIYGPALALSQVTGLEVKVSCAAVIVTCIFYTTLGGMRAVVWTDTIQVITMYGSLLAIVTKGSYDVGGPAAVWQANNRSGRIELFNFDVNPATRLTVWNTVIGDVIFWLATYGVGQTHVQRYMAMPTLQRARRALWVNAVAISSTLIVCYSLGMILYAKYQHCDPLSANLIQRRDQMVPLFVVQSLENYPGMPGLFVAGVFSASLSTLSSGLNSLAAILMEDFLRPYAFRKISDATATSFLKAIAVIYGIICFGFTVLASRIQSILVATATFYGYIAGPLLAVFSLGIFVPWANATGASVGVLSSLGIMGWIVFGTIAMENAGRIPDAVPKPTSTDGCLLFNASSFSYGFEPSSPEFSSTAEFEDPVLSVYQLSFAWYPVYGYAIVMIVGTIVSLLYKKNDPRQMDPRLACNLGETVFFFLPRRAREWLRFKVGDNFKPATEA